MPALGLNLACACSLSVSFLSRPRVCLFCSDAALLCTCMLVGQSQRGEK